MKLIYEKSRPDGRRTRSPGTTCRRRRSLPSSACRAAAASGDGRVRARAPLHGADHSQLRRRHRLLSARLLHDEAQPARERGRRPLPRLRRPPPAAGGGRRAGRARAHVAAPGDPRGGLRPGRGVAPAGSGIAGRADGPHAHARVLRRPRRGRPEAADRRAGYRPRHESGERDDGRLRARAGGNGRSRQHRPRGSPRKGRRVDGRPHAHEPVDARAFRRGDRRGDSGSSTEPARSCTTTARTSMPSAASRGPATWASTSSTSTSTRRSRSRTAAADPAVGRSPFAACWSRFCPCRRSFATATDSARLRPAEDDRQGAGLLGPVRRLRPLVRVHPVVRAGAPRDVRGGGAQRELPARAAARLVRPAVRPPLHARVRALRAHAEARARHHRARRREAAHGLRVPSADDLLPARRAGGADDRADGDRGEGDARRVRRSDAGDRRTRPATTPSCCARRRTLSPSAASTRSRP